MFPGLGLYCTDPVQHLTAAGEVLDDLDHDLSVDDLVDVCNRAREEGGAPVHVTVALNC